jgi:hypothetical protein
LRLIDICLVVHMEICRLLYFRVPYACSLWVYRYTCSLWWVNSTSFTRSMKTLFVVISSIDPDFDHEIICMDLAVILFIHPSQNSEFHCLGCFHCLHDRLFYFGVPYPCGRIVPPVCMFFLVGEYCRILAVIYGCLLVLLTK